MDFIEIVNIAKYIVGGIGCIGLIVLVVGLYGRNSKMIQQGVMLFIVAVVLFICGYFILKTTAERIESRYNMEKYYNP